jgi:hypothetical protein
MRIPSVVLLAALVLSGAACSLDQLMKQQGGSTTPTGDAGTGEGGADAAAAVQGAGCGVDSESGAQLCRATALCPNVVVDSETFPHCGFRIRGSVVDLVCGCGQVLCSMGVYSTCAQAAQLLTAQTEQQVCMQVNDNRCTPVTTSSSSSSSSSSGSTCDKACLAECGGGSACASVCGC